MVNSNPFVYVVIVNYESCEDTLECLESVLKSEYVNFKIVLVDNCSYDDSVNRILRWCKNYDGLNFAYYRYLSDGKQYVEIKGSRDPKLIFIQTDENKGFAGGNNIGIRFVGQGHDGENIFYWLLNNDTIASKNALGNLIEFYLGSKRSYGVIVLKLMNYDDRNIVQSIGVNYCPFSGLFKIFGDQKKDRGQYDHIEDIFKHKLSYVSAASFFMTPEVIKNVGLLCEDYFLYHEEIDYAFRMRKKGYKMGVCCKSVVYHKQGRSTGTPDHRKINFLSAYLGKKGDFIFTKRYYPLYLPVHFFVNLISILKLIIKGNFKKAYWLLKAFKGFMEPFVASENRRLFEK